MHKQNPVLKVYRAGFLILLNKNIWDACKPAKKMMKPSKIHYLNEFLYCIVDVFVGNRITFWKKAKKRVYRKCPEDVNGIKF